MIGDADTDTLQLTLYTTRPDTEGRLPKENAVYDLLEELNISFVRIDHPAAPTIEACQKIDSLLGVGICKNLFLCNAQKTNFYLLMMPGHKKFKTRELSAQLGVSRLSFAEEGFMKEFLDVTPGSVSVLGLMHDRAHRVRLVIDKEVKDSKFIGCHPCVNTSSLKIASKDILGKFLDRTQHSYTVVEL